MAARIDQHRLDRPTEWPTVEEPLFGADHVASIPDEHLLILDCLTLLVSNLLFAEQPIADHVGALAGRLATRGGPTVVVSNEVGMGVHPETPLGRTYRDELGRANRIVADHSEDALLIVAGRALALEPVTAIGPALRQPPGDAADSPASSNSAASRASSEQPNNPPN
jgi:adenosyl cobinamide kinase/adenosyl cobinamide phosphate guanylyltransferase